jgi:hypothetical protein
VLPDVAGERVLRAFVAAPAAGRPADFALAIENKDGMLRGTGKA